MLGSTLNCVKTASALILVSVLLSACGGSGGLPEGQSTAPINTNNQQGTPLANGLNSTTGISDNSVRNTTEGASNTISANIETSSIETTLSGTIDRSTTAYSSSPAQVSSRDNSLSGTIDRSVTASSLTTNLTTKSIAAASIAASSKAALITSSKAASSLAISSIAASSIAISSKASSLASSSKASSIASSSKASSSVASSSKANSSVASSKANNNNALAVSGATIQWSPPTARENGTYLNLNEIGGYLIRYKAHNAADYSYITIPGNMTTSYNFPLAILGLELEIAVYDSLGIYSDFVPIPPY